MNSMLQTKKDIEDWLQLNDVNHYEIQKNTTQSDIPYMVEVRDSVGLSRKDLTFFPVQFGVVYGNFHCEHNQLKNLIGAPTKVGGNFYCANNLLVSLEGSPSLVLDQFVCNKNYLTSLKGCPQNFMRGFYCANNLLKSLEFSPPEIKLDFSATTNRLTSLKYCPKKIGGNFFIFENNIENLAFFPEKASAIFCDKNPLLGDIQSMRDFNELYDIHKKHQIVEEQKELLSCLVKSSKSMKNKKTIKV